MDMDQLTRQLNKQGLTDRTSQREMISAVYEALTHKRILCIEAPTGTGKTLSYGIASLMARHDQQQIIISTATIALQEQLISKDLPLLANVLSSDFTYVLAKGRRRYVCHAKLYEPHLELDESEETLEIITQLQKQIENKKWKGDRDHLKLSITEPLWQKISTDATGCLGKRCGFYENCAFYKARRKMHQADVIVTNHSLLLSDLELGGNTILPDPKNCVYIIDECHHFPQKALSHFAKTAGLMSNVEWINQLTKLMSKAEQMDLISHVTSEAIKPFTHHLIQQIKILSDYLEQQKEKFLESSWILTLEEQQSLLPLTKEIKLASTQLYQHCEKLQKEFELKQIQKEKLNATVDEELNRLLLQVQFVTNRAKNLHETWALFCHERQPKEAPIAKWFSSHTDFQSHAAPINVSAEIKKTFLDSNPNGIIFCSATLRVLGDFKDFYRRMGLQDHERATTVAIEPFFDYTQSILYVPKMQYAPHQAPQAHHTEVMDLLPKLIPDRGGALVIFTSIHTMEKTYEDLSPTIKNDILMQNQHSKRHIIDLHKDRVRAQKRSILFGLASFGEGLDLPADFCQRVLIYKLPFSVPTTPLEVTRNQWLKANQKNAFTLCALPETSLRLNQYIGRLIRQETDRGVVAIFDNRLYSQGYGRSLLKNVPPFRQIINEPIETLLPLLENF